MARTLGFDALRPLLVLALLAAGSGAALARADIDSREYRNGTFGYTLTLADRLMSNYQSVTSPAGITLTRPDGLVVMNIFGSWNEAGKSLDTIVDQYKRGLGNADITYEWHGTRAAVVSGYQGGDIFYVRIAMSPDRDRVAVLNMVYAPQVKRELDPVVSQLSTSLSIR